MAVDNRSEIKFFSIPHKTLPWQTNSLLLMHGCRWTQAASGAARRANVGLRPASSFQCFERLQVYGYVLVASNLVSRIPLTSLRLIRGLVQFKPQSGVGLSLYVVANYHRQQDGSEMGLRVLELPSLRGIRTVRQTGHAHLESPHSYDVLQDSHNLASPEEQ